MFLNFVLHLSNILNFVCHLSNIFNFVLSFPSKMPFKKCFVLSCSNTSENCENKLFILIPNNKDIRTRWFHAVNRPFTTTKDMYCCEDHFDLEVDMENWMQFKWIGSRVHMKKDVFPHKFIDKRKPDTEITSQLTLSSRKRKLDTL